MMICDLRLQPLTPDLVPAVRSLNTAIFPVVYNDYFYKELPSHPQHLNYLAFYKNDCVGSICCRKEKISETSYRVYIMTLGVLAPYRRLKIGSMLLNQVLESVKHDPSIQYVALHVHVSNEDAVMFYLRHHFQIRERVNGYYVRNRGVDPPDAFFLVYQVHKIS